MNSTLGLADFALPVADAPLIVGALNQSVGLAVDNLMETFSQLFPVALKTLALKLNLIGSPIP
jgi:hypothetical protein